MGLWPGSCTGRAGRTEDFRALFGDESLDYATSLVAHYAKPPNDDWRGGAEGHDSATEGSWNLIKAGAGGSVIIISSLAGFKGLANVAAYTTAKHGIVGLMKVLANELGPHGIRVNTIHPNSIDTPMVKNKKTYKSDAHLKLREICLTFFYP